MKRKREYENSTLSSSTSFYQATPTSLPSSVIPSSISGISSSLLAHSFQAPKAPIYPIPHRSFVNASDTERIPSSSTKSSRISSTFVTKKNKVNSSPVQISNTTGAPLPPTPTVTTTALTSTLTTSPTVHKRNKNEHSSKASTIVTKIQSSSNWAKLKAKVARPDLSKESGNGTDNRTIFRTNEESSSSTLTTPTVPTNLDTKQTAIATIQGPFPVKPLSTEEQKYVALDCEMVGVGNDGLRSALALVVIVDYYGRVIYQKYVQPTEPVTDYRTFVSGIRPEHLVKAENFRVVQKEVSDIIRNKIVVGHGLINDMKALLLSHSWKSTRDTAAYRLFTFKGQGGKMRAKKLKLLVHQHLGIDIQTGEHEPAEDARAALALYKLFRRQWEHEEAGIKMEATGKSNGKHKSHGK